jgi:CRISPR system Cascade subunit CasE
MSALWLSRASLREDAGLDALAKVLLPEDEDARAGMAHRLIWTLFADGPDRARDFLWREDKPGQFVTLSARPPAERQSLLTVETKAFAPVLEAGDRLGFRLRANPTIDHVVPGRTRRSQRVDVVMDALRHVPVEGRAEARPEIARTAGAAWLMGIGVRHGFTLGETRIDGYRTRRIPRDGPTPMRLSTLEFEGVLTVTDPVSFLARLTAGFGRARGFGYGLMLIRRA